MHTGFGQRQRRASVILQGERHRTDHLAFVRDIVPWRRTVTNEILLDVGKQRQRLIESHRQRHAPGDREPHAELTTHELVRKLSLPAKQGEQVPTLHHRHRAMLDPIQCLVRVTRRDRMRDSFRPQLLGGKPMGGAPMQL